MLYISHYKATKCFIFTIIKIVTQTLSFHQTSIMNDLKESSRNSLQGPRTPQPVIIYFWCWSQNEANISWYKLSKCFIIATIKVFTSCRFKPCYHEKKKRCPREYLPEQKKKMHEYLVWVSTKTLKESCRNRIQGQQSPHLNIVYFWYQIQNT